MEHQEEQDTGQEGFGSQTEEETPGGGQGDEGSENPLPSEGGDTPGGGDAPEGGDESA